MTYETYFVQKEAIYPHGVYWIGSDQQKGIDAANEAAMNDEDSHHDWVLFGFNERALRARSMDIEHDEIYRTNKGEWQ